MNTKRTILIICFNTLHNDPRILRQIKALKDEFNIIAAGYSDPGLGTDYVALNEYKHKMIDFFFNYPWLFRKFFALCTRIYLWFKRYLVNLFYFRIEKFILLNFSQRTKSYYYERRYWRFVEQHYDRMRDLSPDVIIANDVATLPLAVRLKCNKSKLVFDAHEYHPEELNEIEEWRKNEKPEVIHFLKKFLPKVNLMFTVSEPIAREYEKNYNVRPVVITNAPAFTELDPVQPGEKIRLIHHGGAIKERLLEETINVIKHLDENYSLDLMLIPSDPAYLESLKAKYGNDARITFKDPVPTSSISKAINTYDIGIYILPPLNFNNINALPNKFFEFIQARLAVAIGPMPAMAEIVNAYQLGVVAEDYSSEALAKKIRTLTRDKLFTCKKNAGMAAKELCAEKNKEILLNEIKNLVN
jgi:hypothetical protein